MVCRITTACSLQCSWLECFVALPQACDICQTWATSIGYVISLWPKWSGRPCHAMCWALAFTVNSFCILFSFFSFNFSAICCFYTPFCILCSFLCICCLGFGSPQYFSEWSTSMQSCRLWSVTRDRKWQHGWWIHDQGMIWTCFTSVVLQCE